jgi:hypothetical protein
MATVEAGQGNNMTGDKGKRPATVIPEASLSDKLSSDPKLDRTVQTRIGDQLRAMYDDLMQQPLPDKLRDLLARLDQPGEEGTR